MIENVSKKKAALIVPVYNAASWLAPCLNALDEARRTSGYDIFVQDDASPDLTVRSELSKIHTAIPTIKMGRNTHNMGFVGTCNTLFQKLRDEYDYVFLVNSDVIATPHCFDIGVAIFERDPNIALVSFLATRGAQLSVELPDGVDYLDFSAYLESLGHQPPSRAVTSVGHLLGIRCSSIPSDSLLFDEKFGKGYGEESDLHYRMLAKGFAAVVAPNAFVFHRGEASFGDAEKKFVQHFYGVWGKEHEKAELEEQKNFSLGWLKSYGHNTLLPHHATGAQEVALKRLEQKVNAKKSPRLKIVVIGRFQLDECFDEVCLELLNFQRQYDEVLCLVESGALMQRRLPVKCFVDESPLRVFAQNEVLKKVMSRFPEYDVLSKTLSASKTFLNSVASLQLKVGISTQHVSNERSADSQGRLAVVAPDYVLSGGIFVIKEFVKALSDAGFEVTLITRSGQRNPQNGGYGYPNVGIELLSASNPKPFDALIFTWWESLFWAYRIPAKRFVWLAQSIEEYFIPANQLEQRLRILAPYLLRGIDVISVSPWIQAEMSTRFGIESVLIPNQLNADVNWQKYVRKREWRNISNPGNAKVVIEGSFQRYKGLDEAISLVDSLEFKDKTLIFSGEIDHTGRWQTLRSSGWKVINNALREDVLAEFQSSDVLIRTSYLDSFGFAPLEMMATEGLVFVKHYQGVPGLCFHDWNAVVFSDAAEIRAAFERHGESQGAYFASLAENGRRFAHEQIGAANKKYVEAVTVLIRNNPSNIIPAAIQLLCGWWATGGKVTPELEHLTAVGHGLATPKKDDEAAKSRSSEIVYHGSLPLRYRIADAVIIGLVKRLVPMSVYRFAKQLIGKVK